VLIGILAITVLILPKRKGKRSYQKDEGALAMAGNHRFLEE
jgi:hypothetical protein